jgi:hypothetical protein
MLYYRVQLKGKYPVSDPNAVGSRTVVPVKNSIDKIEAVGTGGYSFDLEGFGHDADGIQENAVRRNLEYPVPEVGTGNLGLGQEGCHQGDQHQRYSSQTIQQQ